MKRGICQALFSDWKICEQKNLFLQAFNDVDQIEFEFFDSGFVANFPLHSKKPLDLFFRLENDKHTHISNPSN